MENNEIHLRYIGDMTVELAKMARTDHLDSLAYLLEMAALEAGSSGKKSDDVPSH